jgi:hypothetical protein
MPADKAHVRRLAAIIEKRLGIYRGAIVSRVRHPIVTAARGELIDALSRSGWIQARIGDQLGIHRTTVTYYIRTYRARMRKCHPSDPRPLSSQESMD